MRNLKLNYKKIDVIKVMVTTEKSEYREEKLTE